MPPTICQETLSMPYCGMHRRYSRLNLLTLCWKNWIFFINKELPHNTKCQSLIKVFSVDCFIRDDIIWCHIKWQFETSLVVIFLLSCLIPEVLTESHGTLLSGQDGQRMTAPMFLLARHGRSHCCWPQILLLLSTLLLRSSSATCSSLFTATAYQTRPMHPCWSFWAP